ncbi:MAG: PilW family protein [Nitrospirae bacterium]|nr:PilW family protein [Nitrospirota bacterium]MCL5238733.1 PilW family protein [Nitrospirota bacterium]
MIKKQAGFSIIELLIVMALFVVVLAITTTTSTTILRQSTQQAKVAETQMESIVGLEMLRLDIGQAGYGLPWSYSGALTGYTEASSSPSSSYNDTSTTPPRAIVGGNDLTTFVINNSDYLVIKSTISGMNDAAKKWSYIVTGTTTQTWGTDDLSSSDRIIAVRPTVGDTTIRQLVLDSSSNFSTTYSTLSNLPVQASDLIYGVDSNSTLSVPFNRADYYVKRPSTGMPSQCNPSTGILYKATLNQNGINGGGLSELPLLDCVADMQVVFTLDMNDDGVAGTFSNPDGSTVTGSEGASVASVQSTLGAADMLRKRLKEVRVYILVHEGQQDINYTYPNITVTLGDSTWPEGVKKTFILATMGGNWQNYRWKVHTLVVKPKNLY